ncbi:carbohydrate ABC transporter permease [Rubellimicrobium aerolatum]|uniref:Carbohydrate ABC transporter permease n=1 Tax=Rubellimicrobium aerolatum TaxID=490979 RepID=A0ABW0SF24_9RHOB|nr:carbohydrate ABC transporter permease [Rubellimicrobium aerolatum]MBP1807082.1 multiple sugar transport system permease protein [Rubellimicrobium aerolatum]
MTRPGVKWTTFALWVLFSLLTLLPIWWMFLVSVKSRTDLFGRPSFLLDISRITWDNYATVIANPAFQRYMLNSLIVSTANAALVCALGLLAAYAMSRYRMRGKDNIFFWVLTNRMAPPAAFLLPLYLLYTGVFQVGDWSLFDTRIGLILLYCVLNLPFAFWLLQGIIDGIPAELDEAAYVDGASTWQVLRTIIVPLAGPGIAVTGILTWVFAWNEYLFASTLTSVNARTITTGLAEFVTVTGTNWGQMAAVAMLTLLPAALVLAVVQKHIVAGLTFGAVKG